VQMLGSVCVYLKISVAIIHKEHCKSMRILALSIGPIGPDIASGGATKCLLDLGMALSKRGHRIDILGPQRSNLARSNELNRNLAIHAVLPYRPSFPGAYDIPPYQHVRLVQELERFQRNVDLIYVHDAGFLYQEWFRGDVPLIVSLRDLLYQETIFGAMSFRRDLMVVNSSYLHDCVMASIGNVCSEMGYRMRIIENGIDWTIFRKGVVDKRLDTLISRKSLKFPILLHPHRPDPRKGLPFVLEVLQKLRRMKGFESVTILIPKHSPDGQFHIQEIPTELRDHVVAHPWLPRSIMPAYYGLGDATLCLGEFVEAFGSNVVLESLACGVPVIQTKVAAHRNTLPDGLTTRCDPGDVDGAVEAIVVTISQGSHSESDWREALSKQFSLERMIDSYESLFMNAKVLPPIRINQFPDTSRNDTLLRLAPWCFTVNGRVYHDYLGTWSENPLTERIAALLGRQSLMREDIKSTGIENESIDQLIEEGYLVIDYGSGYCRNLQLSG